MPKPKQRIVVLMDHDFNPTIYVENPGDVDLVILNQNLDGVEEDTPSVTLNRETTILETGWGKPIKRLGARVRKQVDNLLSQQVSAGN